DRAAAYRARARGTGGGHPHLRGDRRARREPNGGPALRAGHLPGHGAQHHERPGGERVPLPSAHLRRPRPHGPGVPAVRERAHGPAAPFLARRKHHPPRAGIGGGGGGGHRAARAQGGAGGGAADAGAGRGHGAAAGRGGAGAAGPGVARRGQGAARAAAPRGRRAHHLRGRARRHRAGYAGVGAARAQRAPRRADAGGDPRHPSRPPARHGGGRPRGGFGAAQRLRAVRGRMVRGAGARRRGAAPGTRVGAGGAAGVRQRRAAAGADRAHRAPRPAQAGGGRAAGGRDEHHHRRGERRSRALQLHPGDLRVPLRRPQGGDRGDRAHPDALRARGCAGGHHLHTDLRTARL
ncbi:MAG: Heat-inducible transcription repressor HrcA, partial [uncultured Gemmatimonadetes bacterium]